jgi:hypothetical protein
MGATACFALAFRSLGLGYRWIFVLLRTVAAARILVDVVLCCSGVIAIVYVRADPSNEAQAVAGFEQ